MYKNCLDTIILLTLLLLPLYAVKVSVFSIPSNIAELLALLSIACFFAKKENAFLLKTYFQKNTFLLYSVAFIIIGFIISLAFSRPTLAGAGIIKGWLVVPIIFAITTTITFQKKPLLPFLALFYSSSFVAIIALVYKFFGFLTYDNRLEAFYGSPNFLAMYLLPGILIGSSLIQNQSSARKKGRFILLIISLCLAFYYTFSYASWIALTFAGGIALLTPKKGRCFLFFFLALPVLLFFLFQFQSHSQKFSDTIHVAERSSLSSRFMIWKSALLMVKNNPILGIGPGNFQQTYLDYQKYFTPYLEWAVPHPHNLFIAMFLYSGLVGTIGFVTFIVLALHAFFLHKEKMPQEALIGFLLIAATLILGLLDTPILKNDLAFMFWTSALLSLHALKRNSV